MESCNPITYKEIITLLNCGIRGNVKNGSRSNIGFGFRGGMYLGAPGKDIYVSLPFLSWDEKKDIARILASKYPHKPPSNHVKWAACIRYIYGCFEKQGCLRSDSDKQRMQSENRDWAESSEFMDLVRQEFADNNNKYGMIIWNEMTAHRYGDRAVIEENPLLLNDMIQLYQQAHLYAVSIKSWKHTFTPFFWAGSYYHEMKMPEESVKWHTESLRMMNKYCPDAREGYREKAKISLKHIKEDMSNDEWKEWYKNFKKTLRNKCLKKVVK